MKISKLGNGRVVLSAVVAAVASIGMADPSFATNSWSEVDGAYKDRVLSAVSRIMAKSLRAVSDDVSRRLREDNFRCVSNILHECKFDFKFARMDDGTPFLIDTVGGCDGAYKDISCCVAIDDKYAHGCALYPEANAKNANVVEFVTLANRIVEKGSFEYDPEFGFVMYTHSMPVSAIRSKGKSALGMIYGFPVMEVDLFSEAYKAVLDNKAAPKDAIALVENKLKKIRCENKADAQTNPSEEALAAIRKFFEGKGHSARAVKFGDRIGFAGTTTGGKKEGLRNENYDFRVEVDDECVYSFVRLPNVSTNQQAEIRRFITLVNKELHDSCNTLVYEEQVGAIICRSQIHVVEFLEDVPDSISRLLRHPVDILDNCSASIEKITCGACDAAAAIEELKKSQGKREK